LDPGAGMPQWRLPFSCSAGFEFVTPRPFHFFFRCRPAKTSTLKSRGAWEASPCATPRRPLFACKLEEDRISYTVRLGIFGMVSKEPEARSHEPGARSPEQEAGSSWSGVRLPSQRIKGEGGRIREWQAWGSPEGIFRWMHFKLTYDVTDSKGKRPVWSLSPRYDGSTSRVCRAGATHDRQTRSDEG